MHDQFIVDGKYFALIVYIYAFLFEGLRDAGNRRPAAKPKGRVRGRQTKEVKAAVPSKQPLVQNMPPAKQQPQVGNIIYIKSI